MAQIESNNQPRSNLESNPGDNQELNRAKPVLPMFGAQTQGPHRGSFSASRTQINTTGQYMATVALFIAVTRLLGDRKGTDIAEIDDLDADKLAAAVIQRLLGRTDFEEPGGELLELRNRLTTLRSLRAKRQDRMIRELEVAVFDVISEKIQGIRRRLQESLEFAPASAGVFVGSAKVRLDALEFREFNVDRFQQFESCVRGLLAIWERRGVLPQSTVDYVIAQLRENAKKSYCAALYEIVRDAVGEALRLQVKNLRATLSEITRTAAQFVRNLEVVRSMIEANQATGLDTNAASPSSIVLLIPGPTESEVFAAMLEANNCVDLLELASHIANRLENRLRERAKLECPALAEAGTLGGLIIRLTPETVADTYVELFRHSLGPGHSLYEIVEKFGLNKVAVALWERAAPLVNLSNRDTPEFNITPYVHAIVRMPKLVHPRDGQIQQALIKAFPEGATFSLREAAESLDDAISVVRIIAGFPICVDSAGPTLLQNYARCAAIAHPVHLIGFFEESPEGLALSKYVRLARELNSQH